MDKLDLQLGKQEPTPMIQCENCGLTHPPRRTHKHRRGDTWESMTECVLRQRQVMHALLKAIGVSTGCRECTEAVVRIRVDAKLLGIDQYFTPDGEPHICRFCAKGHGYKA